MGDLCTIALVACAEVSLHLPGNRARRPVDLAPDLGLGKPAFRKGGNKISFFLGEVLVAHRCIPFSWQRKDACTIAPLPPLGYIVALTS